MINLSDEGMTRLGLILSCHDDIFRWACLVVKAHRARIKFDDFETSNLEWIALEGLTEAVRRLEILEGKDAVQTGTD